MKYIRAILSAVFWGISIYKSGKKNYKSGFIWLSLSERVSGGADAEMLLLKVFLLAVIGREAEAENIFNDAEIKINRSSEFNNDEKKYLSNYRVSMIRLIRSDQEYGELTTDYDVENISKHLIKNHPFS